MMILFVYYMLICMIKIMNFLKVPSKPVGKNLYCYFSADVPGGSQLKLYAKRFYELTKENIGKPMGCFVGETFFSAPIVHAPISGGMAQIVGNFNEKQMKLIRQLEMQKN